MLQPWTFVDDLTPHGYCLLWEPGLIWTHLAADLVIAIAYLSIPAALAIIGMRRPDLNPKGILYFFAAFIILCAITHIFGIVTIWLPIYSLEAGAKVVTALVSVVTSVLIWLILDSILKSPTRIAMRSAYDALARANAELERRVEERTEELSLSNERLRHAAEEARQAEQTKAQFLQRMSHELRTPLNAIMGFNELLDLQLGGPMNTTQRAYCSSIRTASSHLLDQINDILDLERLQQSGPEFHPEIVSLERMLADVSAMLKPLSQEKNVEIFVEAGAESTWRTDRRTIRTILTNLMSNAIKYSRTGGFVRVIVSRRTDGVAVEVSDNGVGIPKEKQHDIFEPFFRCHERDLPNVGGTGLGLTLVKQLIIALGGQIALQSDVGVGTSVNIMIPEMANAKVVGAQDC